MSEDAYQLDLVAFEDDRFCDMEDPGTTAVDQEEPEEAELELCAANDDAEAAPWFADWIHERMLSWAGAQRLPHPSEVCDPTIMGAGAKASGLRSFAEGRAAHDQLRAKLAGDPQGQALLDEAVEGIGVAILALMGDMVDEADRRRLAVQSDRRKRITAPATKARLQLGEPQRQWALAQKAAGVPWGWTVFYQQTALEFHVSDRAASKTLSPIRHLLDPKQTEAANSNSHQGQDDVTTRSHRSPRRGSAKS